MLIYMNKLNKSSQAYTSYVHEPLNWVEPIYTGMSHLIIDFNFVFMFYPSFVCELLYLFRALAVREKCGLPI